MFKIFISYLFLSLTTQASATPDIQPINREDGDNAYFYIGHDAGKYSFRNTGSTIQRCYTEPALPPGLVINPKTCEITGQPQVSRQMVLPITVIAEDSLIRRIAYEIEIRINQPFIVKWRMTSWKHFTLPLVSNGSYDFIVDWGDGSPRQEVTSFNDPDKEHTYELGETYIIKIWGKINKIRLAGINVTYQDLLEIINVGSLRTGSWSFHGALHLTSISGIFDMQGIENADSMFSLCRSLNSNLEFINTEAVATTKYMFSDTESLNSRIRIDTRAVKKMNSMFARSAFNQPIELNTSSVNDMSRMFEESNFNQELNINTRYVRDMSHMFYKAKNFNQPVEFDVSRVKNMEAMFAGTEKFNQEINFEDSVLLTDASHMFFEAKKFNSPIKLDTSNVIDMNYMFTRAYQFNQPLNFNTSKVETMVAMFKGARRFNQSLESFTTHNVRDMNNMFNGASSFNQTLTFNYQAISHPNQLSIFLNNSGLDRQSVDETLFNIVQFARYNGNLVRNVILTLPNQPSNTLSKDILENSFNWQFR